MPFRRHSSVARRASSRYNGSEGLKEYSQGESPGKWNTITSPGRATEKDV